MDGTSLDYRSLLRRSLLPFHLLWTRVYEKSEANEFKMDHDLVELFASIFFNYGLLHDPP